MPFKDPTCQDAVQLKQGGNTLAVGSGGTIGVDSGGTIGATAGALKLPTAQTIGVINIDITDARVVAGNDIQNSDSTHFGGTVSKSSTPILERANGATDIALRLDWATSVVNEVQFGPIVAPKDLDPTTACNLMLMLAKSSNTDTVTLTTKVFEGIGGTNLSSATATLAQAATKTAFPFTLATGYPNDVNISITPGAHADDAVYLYGVWLEYTKKSS